MMFGVVADAGGCLLVLCDSVDGLETVCGWLLQNAAVDVVVDVADVTTGATVVVERGGSGSCQY